MSREKTDFVTRSLREIYTDRGFLCFENVRNHTGYQARERYIDLFAIHPHPSRMPLKDGRPAGIWRIAFEVKTSLADFKKELLDPTKREPFVNQSNEFYFVTQTGLIDPEMIPFECGLIEIADDGKLKIVRPSGWNEQPPNWAFVASLLRSSEKGKVTRKDASDIERSHNISSRIKEST